jgi:excisionase family DNA binding protein
MPEQQPELLNARQAAAHLGLSENTVRAWVRLRRIRYVRVGRRSIRFRPDDLDAMVRPVEPVGGDAA